MSAQQLLEPEDALQDLSIQMQMFAHAPTRQAWDIVQELYNRAEVQLHPDFARVHEKIKMFFAVVLSRQPEWAATDEHKQLLSQANVRINWLLSPSGDNPRKLDLIWHAYFASGDTRFSDKVVQIANELNYATGLRETAVWSYHLIASTAYPDLCQRAPAIMKMGEHLQTERLKK